MTPINHSYRILLATSLLTGLLGNGAVWAQKTNAPKLHHVATGHDPFNRVQADSTKDFVWHLRNNPTLRSRYAQHFGVPESEVIDFIKNALVIQVLPAPRKMTTYGVARTGQIYPVHVTLAKGTKVWATREGVPVLKWTCSNPLQEALPGQSLRKTPTRFAKVPKTTKPKVSQTLSIAGPGNLDHVSSYVTEGVRVEDVNGNIVALAPVVPEINAPEGIVAINTATTPTVQNGFAPISEAKQSGRPRNGAEILLPLIFGSSSALLPAYGTGTANAGQGIGKTRTGEGPTFYQGPVTAIPETPSGLLLSTGMLFSGVALTIRRKRKP